MNKEFINRFPLGGGGGGEVPAAPVPPDTGHNYPSLLQEARTGNYFHYYLQSDLYLERFRFEPSNNAIVLGGFVGRYDVNGNGNFVQSLEASDFKYLGVQRSSEYWHYQAKRFLESNFLPWSFSQNDFELNFSLPHLAWLSELTDPGYFVVAHVYMKV